MGFSIGHDAGWGNRAVLVPAEVSVVAVDASEQEGNSHDSEGNCRRETEETEGKREMG